MFGDEKVSTIREASELSILRKNKEDYYPAIIFIRVVLSANRKFVTHVRPNLKRIKKDYPELKSFDDLRKMLDKMSREEFFDFWRSAPAWCLLLSTLASEHILLFNCVDHIKVNTSLRPSASDDLFFVSQGWSQRVQ